MDPEEGTGLESQLETLSVEFSCSPVDAWVLTGDSSFLPGS